MLSRSPERGKTTRRRGLFLSDSGLSRVHDAFRRLAADRDGVRVPLETFSATACLSTRTLSRLLNRTSPVDHRTVETLFFALNLVPGESDWYYATQHSYQMPLNLPQRLTSLIGRDEVLEALEELMQTSRLITLVGIGGIGKTRLAIELCRRHERRTEDRTYFFDFKATSDERERLTSLTAALGIAIDDRGTFNLVRNRLNIEPTILLLDNCEGLSVFLRVLIQRILDACPSLRVLATRREPLGVGGEHVFRVQPLSMPHNMTQLATSDAIQYPALVLFAERARAFNDNFILDDETAPVIAELIYRCDGLPLGIELAAARTAGMSSVELLRYLQNNIIDLTSDRCEGDPRHRSMRTIIESSFEGLTEQERIVLSRAAVFGGTFDAEALTAVCCDFLSSEGLMHVVSQLAMKSLIGVNAHTRPTRFALMNTVRRYALERLCETVDSDFVHWSHALHYLELTATLMRSFREEGQTEDLRSLMPDFSNVTRALEWSFATHNGHIGAVIVSELTDYWDAHGLYKEGEEWIRRALDINAGVARPATIALLWEGLSLLLYRQERYEEADRAARYCATRYEELGDVRGVSRAQNVLGNVDFDTGNMESARERYLANLKRGQQLSHRITLAALFNLGRIELNVDRNARAALSRFERSLELATEIGRQSMVAFILGELGETYASLGNLFLALDFSRRSMRAFHELRNDSWYCRQAIKTAIFRIRACGYKAASSDIETAHEAILSDPYRAELCEKFDLIAELLVDLSEAERAVILLVAAQARRSREGLDTNAQPSCVNREILQRARQKISEESYTRIFGKARNLSLEVAFREALIKN